MGRQVRFLIFFFGFFQVTCATLDSRVMKDEFLWLEQISSTESKKWVSNQNEKTLSVLYSEDFKKNYGRSLKTSLEIEQAPEIKVSSGYVYAIWYPKVGSRGVWKRIPVGKADRHLKLWETVLDIDNIAAKENKSWILKDIYFLHGKNRCLVGLSNGGSDKVEIREFDLIKKEFVQNGFNFPEQKIWVQWIDLDHLAVSKSFEKNGFTNAGYGNQMRIYKRGDDKPGPVQLSVPNHYLTVVLESHQTSTDSKVIAYRYNSLDDTTLHLVSKDGVINIPVPAGTAVNGIIDKWYIVTIRRDWSIENSHFTKGSVVALKIDNSGSVVDVKSIFKPNSFSAVQSVAVTKKYVTVFLIENVKTKIRVFKKDKSDFIPEVNAIGGEFDHHNNIDSDYHKDLVFIRTEGFLTPPTLFIYGLSTKKKRVLKQQEGNFDSSGMVVKQNWVKSSDGVLIPYFLVGNKNVLLKGDAPVILTAYGGFQNLLLPKYDLILGQQWLEKGGIFASANIRGGGEFGPDWHKVAMKEGRQKSFGDFILVGKDLISQGITSESKLGIYGGSNGGYLIGAVLNLTPNLFGAAMAAVPLLDMLRFSKLLAGSAWIGEYGDPDLAQDRKFLVKYSPYHNIKKEASYPPFFIYTSSLDDRVHPGHARKMAAKLQSLKKENIFYFEHSEGGHSGAATLDQRIFWKSLQFEFFRQKLFGQQIKSP